MASKVGEVSILVLIALPVALLAATVSVEPCAHEGCGIHCSDGTDGIFSCGCPAGFIPNARETACLNIDECESDNGGCEDKCINTDGSHYCRCSSGTLSQDGRSCTLAAADVCGLCDYQCLGVRDDKPVCACPSGYELAQDGLTCIDIDECAGNNGGCVAQCSNVEGSHRCYGLIQCMPGFVQVAYKCESLCNIENGGCSHICKLEDGEVQCDCPGDGVLFTGDNKTCVDPCIFDKNGCEQICEMSDDTTMIAKCLCNDGFELARDGKSCIGRSRHQDCPEDSVLLEINGILSCPTKCPTGLLMDMATGKCTIDVDECEQEIDDCEDVCVNTFGSYICNCTEGKLDVNGKNCTGPDNVCKKDNGGCEHYCAFIEEIGYRCLCKEGFVLSDDLTSCLPLCEVDNGGCKDSAICEMIGPEPTCSCPPGTFLDDDCGECFDVCSSSFRNDCDKYCDSSSAIEGQPFVCSCDAGEVLLEGSKCVDGCHDNRGCEQICVNHMDGEYGCDCSSTEQLNNDGKTCSDKDECLEFNGRCSHTCVNEIGGYHCQCPDDRSLNIDGRTCINYDPCLDDPDLCSYECLYDRRFRKYYCGCKDGWQLATDGKTCISSCLTEENGGCSQMCTLTSRGVVCSCDEGYVLDSDQKTCLDTDECTIPEFNHCEQTCINTDGGFTCSCDDGFALNTDGYTCAAGDPCKVDNGGCSGFCLTVEAKAQCFCSNWFILAEDKKTCIHACNKENNGCQHVCNFENPPRCSCNDGYELMEDEKNCKDIDECKTGSHTCGRNVDCINELGRFTCSCPAGMVNDLEDKSTCIEMSSQH